MSPSTSEIFFYLAGTIINRYQSYADKSLLDVYRVHQDFLKLDPAYFEFMFSNRNSVLRVLNDPQLASKLVKIFVDSSIQFTYENNQFIHLNAEEKNILTHLYQTYLNNLKQTLKNATSLVELENDLSQLLETHFLELRSNISRFFDRETAQNEAENVILKKAVCGEYSPEFQADVLDIPLAELMEPVLDLGCGKSGLLVNRLNAAGIQAVGVDRVVEPSEFLIEADWLELGFTPGTWGTIISHMAFSNHFLFHHFYKNGHPEDYARQYVKILSSLKTGGSFYYSPGLPFIEQFLSEKSYQVIRQELKLDRTNFKDIYPDDVWYAAQVIKK